MISSELLVSAFKAIREGTGMTLDKLALWPDLKQAFNLATDSEFIELVKERTADLLTDFNCKAALVSLALVPDYPGNLTQRRQKMLGISARAYQQNLIQTHRRKENLGFEIIALRLIELLEIQARREADAAGEEQPQTDTGVSEIDELRRELAMMRILLRRTIQERRTGFEPTKLDDIVYRYSYSNLADHNVIDNDSRSIAGALGIGLATGAYSVSTLDLDLTPISPFKEWRSGRRGGRAWVNLRPEDSPDFRDQTITPSTESE